LLANTGHGFRLICTSNEDLEKPHDEGHFQRRNSSIASPRADRACHLARADRGPAVLVKYFTGQATTPCSTPASSSLTDDAMAVLSAYHWPGNLPAGAGGFQDQSRPRRRASFTSQQLPMRARTRDWPNLAEYSRGQQTIPRPGAPRLPGRQGPGGEGAWRGRDQARLSGRALFNGAPPPGPGECPRRGRSKAGGRKSGAARLESRRTERQRKENPRNAGGESFPASRCRSPATLTGAHAHAQTHRP